MLSDGKEYVLPARGNLKSLNKKLITGDKVIFDGGVIINVEERTRELFRPRVANVDIVNIVMATVPKTDFYLVDKIIAECVFRKISVILTVNKCDVDLNTYRYVVGNYTDAVDKIFCVSTATGEGIDILEKFMYGKLCCLAGQSGVGKTSLCNFIFGKNGTVNSVSNKNGCGRQTTTSREIHYSNGLMVIDTPGFTSIELTFDSYSLSDCYKDFRGYTGKCFYVGCVHINEPDCLVKNAVEAGKISADRYKRYLMIFEELRENEKRKY